MSDSSLLIEPLPPGWKNQQFGDVCDRVKDSYQPVDGGNTPYVGLDHLAQGFPAFVGRGKESEVKSSKTAFKVGDILFGKLRPYLRKGAQANFDGVCSTDILAFRAKATCESEFLKFVIHSDEFVAHAKSTTSGVQHPRTSWPSLREFRLSLPPLPEQKKIAHILSTVQRAIETQERIIQTTTELKKALMHKLFTEGLHNEPQKQTEIGPVPESWELVELGELLSIAQYGMSVKGNPEGNYPILRMTNQVNGRIVANKLQFVEIKDSEFGKFKVERGDILFNRTNSLDLVGRTAIHDIEGDYVFASYLIRIRTDEKHLNPFFLNLDFNRDETQVRLKSIATRAVSQSNISATRLKGFPIPLPSVSDQAEIVKAGAGFDSKIELHQTKLAALRDLFSTLLHELMTARIRVNNLDMNINN
ncbi:MAG: restriction endonuclease subunit S [Candidatus Thiodiazotropha sp. (ex. Lucinisca nassula)]|nr:restriction endonuclease subunit S [Candidatus Thiodiazotropha sp. (ex. Lucinisca nassula)]MBW9273082.1 restriction endonuclease subunit S [Candidatus Thiodiazotropha sp. (ex. Lucinisca nassula)]